MSRNKLLVILSFILILLFISGLVYKDQVNKNNLTKTTPTSSYVNKPDNVKLEQTTEKNANVNLIKAPEDADYTYITYKVKPGDHLYSLAKKFMPTYQIPGVIKDIKEKNNLGSDLIQPNKLLTLPAEKLVLNN